MESDRTALLTKILKEELVPALGCTEPIAIAFAAAKARELLQEPFAKAEILCSNNVIKNAKSVYVPMTRGLKGIPAAALIGIYGGDASLGLEVLTKVNDEALARTRAGLKAGLVQLRQLETPHKLDIVAVLTGVNGRLVQVRVTGQHTHVAQIIVNGVEVYSDPADSEDETGLGMTEGIFGLDEAFEFALSGDLDGILPLLEKQIENNHRIAEEGLKNAYGIGAGNTMLNFLGDNVAARAVAKAAAGSDARMGGCELPVVINSGSGNQGMTASLPIIEFAQAMGASQERLYRALTLSNLVAIYQKTKIGRLSAYCGAVNAAAGAAAGLTYLAGGSKAQCGYAMEYVLGTISGLVCDGAKASCASKVAISVQTAVIGSDLALQDRHYQAGDGLIKKTTQETIGGVIKLAKVGMKTTDEVIMQVMLHDLAHEETSNTLG